MESLEKPFIDFSKNIQIICNGSNLTTCNYTATENCIICGYVRLFNRSTTSIYINDIEIIRCGEGDNTYGQIYPIYLFLKKEQTTSIKFTNANNGTNFVAAYQLLR